MNNPAQPTGTSYMLERKQAHSFVLEKCLYIWLHLEEQYDA